MEETSAQEPDTTLPPLDAIEARILGCLIEKAAITPEVYPLTLNALVAACNQKTSREPVMNLEPGAVGHALNELERRGLVKIAPASQRALRYEHRFDSVYGTTARQRAVLCALLLRGPQTLNELHARTERLADFPSLEDLRDTLDRLIQREPTPYVIRLGRGPGQREDRYMHLLAGPVDAEALASASPATSSPRSGAGERIDQLEAEIAELRAEIAELRQRLDAVGA